MTHKSKLIAWSLRPIDRHIILFEASIQSNNASDGLYALFRNGVRESYKNLVVYIHLN